MALDRFLIAPEEVGMQNNIRPWLLPDTGYEQLTNAYIFRGRIRKRFGSRYMTPAVTPAAGREQFASRLRVDIGVTPGPLTIPNSTVSNNLAVGQIFTVGNDIFTITALGNVLTLSTNPAATATINTTMNPNTVTFTGEAAGTDVYWYPSRPVMGLPVWETLTLNNEPTIAFDTQFAYQYLATGWERLNFETTAGAATWTGSDSQFFWAYTYQGVNQSLNYLFVTNFNQNEPNFMRYLDNNLFWNNFSPIYAITFNPAAPPTINGRVIGAQIIIGFHDHLVLLNTWENDSTLGNGLNFRNRARYCAIGTPIDSLLPNPNATAAGSYLPWVDNTDSPAFRGGGYVDNLQTQEAIISATFLNDRLIVGFSRSTWELAYTGNQQLPFVWQLIDPNFGSQSPFSGVELDNISLDVAQNGITACTGAAVARIDDKIPNEVFNINYSNNGTLRVQGIRDYKVEQVYWTIPSNSIGQTYAVTYPNQVWVYNYVTKSWAFNGDSFTCFGYFTQQPAATWGNTTRQWQYMTQTWSDGSLQAMFPNIIAGNQEGYVVIIDSNITRNAGALQITNATITGDEVTLTIVNHNLTDTDIYTNQDEYVYLENIQGTGSWPLLNGVITPILSIVDVNTITVAAFPFTAGSIYTGGGTVTRVSNLNILSKQWNPYVKSGQNVFIQKMNFLVSRTGGVDTATNFPYGGAVQVDYYPNTAKVSTLINSVPGQLYSSGVMETMPYDPRYYPFEQYQDRVWRPQYLAVDGNAIQIRITMNDDQIVNPTIAFSDFQLHGIILETMPTSVRIGG